MSDNVTVSEIENLRRELAEVRREREAIAEALEAVARLADDRDVAFRSLLRMAAHLCGAENGNIYLVQGDYLVGTLRMSDDPGENAFVRGLSYPLSCDDNLRVRCVVRGEALQVCDTYAVDYGSTVLRDRFKFGSFLVVPMMLNGVGVGVFALTRTRPSVFTEAQIALVRGFAAQAAIVVRNARQFQALESRTAELNDALEQQTVTAETLKTLSFSVFDLDAVLNTLARSAMKLCDADSGALALRRNGEVRMQVTIGYDHDLEAYLKAKKFTPGRETIVSRVLLSGLVEMVYDTALDQDIISVSTRRHRSLLGMPLLRDGEVVGVFTLRRLEPGGFTERQIELIKTFADQAVIAIGNVSLFQALEARTEELRRLLEDLHAAQDRLIQTEKLASLGQLTAGIAHEIKNPLNFINNFSALSVGLLSEIEAALSDADLGDATRAEVADGLSLLKSNLERVEQHGKRADSIVKNMLLHSRTGSGDRREVDVNALVEESVNLAYHGARAEKPGFNVTLKRDFDPAAGSISAFPQEITRVVLNLVSNGFYATAQRQETAASGYEPTVTASTRAVGDMVQIRIRDNGVGIPDEVKAKLFNPFFTTKPAGEGTGLGLSLSHDIVVKQHGGAIVVATQLGAFTEFTITLPRRAAQGVQGHS